MKNKILKFSLIAAVAVASSYTAYSQSQESEALSDLTIDNVEALASGENPLCPLVVRKMVKGVIVIFGLTLGVTVNMI